MTIMEAAKSAVHFIGEDLPVAAPLVSSR